MRSGLCLALLKPATNNPPSVPLLSLSSLLNRIVSVFVSLLSFLLHGSVVQWLVGALCVKGCPGLVEEL